jgi:uncharacterized protein YjbJ (UPF0337 family)
MCVTARIELPFACIVVTDRWETSSHALALTIRSWLNNYLEALMNKDQIKGRVDEVKGKVKEAVGVILDDDSIEIEGNIQKNVGKVQAGFGDLKDDIKKDK